MGLAGVIVVFVGGLEVVGGLEIVSRFTVVDECVAGSLLGLAGTVIIMNCIIYFQFRHMPNHIQIKTLSTQYILLF